LPASARTAADFCLEEFVFKRCLDSSLATLLIAFSISLLVFYSILAKLKSSAPTILCRLRVYSRFSRYKLLEPESSKQFDFAHAIEAYEGLIDSAIAGHSR
jgi:hypothetical protein